jgi:predicted acetyltransferase
MLEFIKLSSDNRVALANMLELYQHDLADIWKQDVDNACRYGYDLSEYETALDESDAILLRSDGQWVGFALSNRKSFLEPARWMDQFFILRGHRRKSFGKALAAYGLSTWPGKWEIGVMRENTPAYRFWKSTLQELGNVIGCVECEFDNGWWSGQIFCFASTQHAE